MRMKKLEIKNSGIALDIDDTLSATNQFWVEKLAEHFGKPDDFSHEEIVSRYLYMEHVPFWQTAEAFAWMEMARKSDEIQEALPLIENAKHIVEQLHKIVPIAAYITARPEQVRKGTLNWLSRHSFPEAPLIMRPEHSDHADGNKWKAELLASLYPTVWGIVDDNPGIIAHLPDEYEGTVFLYGRENVEKTNINVVAVKNWEDVLQAVSSLRG